MCERNGEIAIFCDHSSFSSLPGFLTRWIEYCSEFTQTHSKFGLSYNQIVKFFQRILHKTPEYKGVKSCMCNFCTVTMDGSLVWIILKTVKFWRKTKIVHSGKTYSNNLYLQLKYFDNWHIYIYIHYFHLSFIWTAINNMGSLRFSLWLYILEKHNDFAISHKLWLLMRLGWLNLLTLWHGEFLCKCYFIMGY